MQLLLRKFPYIVQREVIKLMKLYDVFAFSTVSKRSRDLVKRMMKIRKVEFHIFIDNFISANREFFNQNDRRNLYLRYNYDPSMETRLQLWNYFNQESINVRVGGEANSGRIVSYWPRELQLELIKYFIEIFPKNTVELSISETNVAGFQATMDSVRRLGENFRYETLNLYTEYDEEPRDELVRTMLMEGGVDLNMSIDCYVSDEFKLDFENTPQLKFKKLCFYHTNWVTKDQLIDMLGSCKQINLYAKQFGDEELSDIFKKWMTGVRVEHLLIEAEDHYNKESTHTMLGELPGAVSIRRANILNINENKFEKQEFEEGKCFMIAQGTGCRALVYTSEFDVILTTRFKLNEAGDINN